MVEDVFFELSEGVLVGLRLQAFVFLQGDPSGENCVDAVVHVGLVVDLVRDEVDGFLLLRVARCEHNLAWVSLAVPLDAGEHPNVREVDFVKNDDVVRSVVELAYLVVRVFGQTYAEKLVQGRAVLAVVLR